MKRDEALRILREHLREIESRHPIQFLALFGSVARDEASPNSDIDVLVAFSKSPGFDGYMSLREHLQELLGDRVDLVMVEALKPWARPEVEKESIRVA